MNPQMALKGKTVFSNGSHAPTKGRVSAQGAQGYLQRSIRQSPGQVQALGGVRRIGGDGQSDTRSGVAAAANERRQFQQPAVRQPYNNEGRRPVGNQRPGGRHQQNAQTAQAQAQQSAIPSVTVNANGQLELPYSADWSADMIDAQGSYNTDIADLQGREQQEGLTYDQTTRDAGIGYGNQKRTSLNQGSASGMAFSTAYGVQASNDANTYQNQLNDLMAQHQAQKTAFDNERSALTTTFNQRLQQGALNLADTSAEDAGKLGYGRNTAKKKPGRNTSVYNGNNKNHQTAAQNAVKNSNSGGSNGGRRGAKK